MSTAIIDARGWQNCFDLRTGDEAEIVGPVCEMVKAVLAGHPYPGDTDFTSNRWVTDTALDLIGRYEPRFVFLTYAQQYFSGRYESMAEGARKDMISRAFGEVERFADASGFAPIIVGTGDMTPVTGIVDLTGLEGLAICTHWSTRYTGLFDATKKDLAFLEGHPGIEGYMPWSEVLSTFGETDRKDARLPEYLLMSRKGYAFRTVGILMKVPVMIPSTNYHIPVYAPGSDAMNITGIRGLIEESLHENKTALIVMEGVGCDDFLWPYRSFGNGKDWFYYEPSEAQYMTITSGRHRFIDFPSGNKYFDVDDRRRDYPFSGIFKSVPQGSFADTFPGKSIAVGNKSMFMHMVTGVDISVECFARNLYNQGTMAVVRRENKV